MAPFWLGLSLAIAVPAAADVPHASGRGAETSGPVGADLERARTAWTESGDLHALPPRLVVRGDAQALHLPPAAVDPTTPGCATLLALAKPTAVFSLAFTELAPDLRRDFPLASSLGLVEVSRCGARKAALAGLVVEAGSPRVVLSLLVQVGEAPAPSVARLLPRRQAGSPASAPDLGPRPELGPLPERLMAKHQARALARPSEIVDAELETDDFGHASHALTLSAGCHTLDVLDASSEAGLTDIDARLMDLGGSTWALDASVAPDAALALCLGEPKRLLLHVRGGGAREALAFLRASWPLPDGMPVEWGPTVRGRLAEALQNVPAGVELGRPVLASLGVQGATRLTTVVEPGRCYVAAVAATGRPPERLGLAGQAGGAASQSRQRADRTSTAITLCATGPRLSLDVDSIGAGASWLLSVWELPGETLP